MKLIQFAEVNTIIAKDQSKYLPIPAYTNRDDQTGRMVFCWKLTLYERLHLLIFGKLWHEVLTFRRPLQPLMLSGKKPKMT